MRRRNALALACFCATPVAAQDFDRGRTLYQTYCGGCHYERVHQRARTSIKDLSDLRDAVARWAPQTKYPFTLDEREDVVEYLNVSHYRIGLPSGRGAKPSGGR
jgi:hypothetical protein